MNETKYRHIDLQKIKEDTFGDTTILRMIIELFVEGIDEFAGILEAQLKTKNWQSLFQATHKIKPNISMFGITALEPIIVELERNFRDEQNLNTIDELVSISLSSFKQVKIELQTELKLIINN